MGGTALALAGCNLPGTDTPLTLDDIVNKVKEACAFTTNWEGIASVVVTIITSFNAGAGAATTVASAVAKTVIDMICGAVDKQVAQLKATPSITAASPGGVITVIVNGVKVNGVYSGK